MNIFYEERPEKLFIGPMTRYPVPPHVHAMAELVVVTQGSTVIGINDALYRLTPGDVAVIFPLMFHSFHELSPDSCGVTTIFPSGIIPEYAGTFQGLEPERPLLAAAETGPEVQFAVSRLQNLNMTDDLPLCIAYLHVLLAGVLHSLTYRPVYNYTERGLGLKIISYLSEHACENITLESTAQALGISVSNLSHFFSEKMRMNFRHFINMIRINQARMMMRNPELTLTWICDACGYSNMRTFRRAFLKEVGRLPSEHMQALRNKVPVREDRRNASEKS